jgi:hypothetical protein
MARGKSLRLSDSQLKDLSAVTPIDILSAVSLWRRSVPFRYRTLLQASVAGATDPGISLYAWDAVNGGYIYIPSGRPVPVLEIRRNAIEPLIASSKVSQRSLSAKYQAGGLSLADWQKAMIESVKSAQVAAMLAANGGEGNTNESDKEEIALIILALLLLLGKWADDIEDEVAPTNGLLLVRSDLYAAAARGSFEDITGYIERVYMGKTEERRVLGHAEHCETRGHLKGCIELAKLGWQPIDSLPKLGQTPCSENCKCHFEYR